LISEGIERVSLLALQLSLSSHSVSIASLALISSIVYQND